MPQTTFLDRIEEAYNQGAFQRQTEWNHKAALKKAAERAQFIKYMEAKESGRPILNTFHD